MAIGHVDGTDAAYVQARRQARKAIREVRELVQLHEALDLDRRKSLGHRLKQLQQASEAYQELLERKQRAEKVLRNREIRTQAKADIAREFLSHIKDQDADPEGFMPVAPDEIVQAERALATGLGPKVNIASDALQIALTDAVFQVKDDYNQIFDAMVEKLNTLKPSEDMPMKEYVEAVEIYEAERDRLTTLNQRIVKQAMDYEMSRVKGWIDLLRTYLINAIDLKERDAKARDQGKKLDINDLVFHADATEREIEKTRFKHQASSGANVIAAASDK